MAIIARLREYTLARDIFTQLLTDNQVNYRMRATMNDGRQLVGQMLAFDKVRCLLKGLCKIRLTHEYST